MAPKAGTFRRNVLMLASAAVIVRLTIGIVSWRVVSHLSETNRQVKRAQDTLGALEAVSADLERVVASQRTYLITGRASERASFETAARRTRQDLALLWTLSADGTEERPLVATLAALADRRLASAESTARALAQGGLAAARDRIVGGEGSAAMEAALGKLGELRAQERAFLEARTREQAKEISRALLGIAVAAVASLAVIVAVALWLLPAFDARVAVRDALRPRE